MRKILIATVVGSSMGAAMLAYAAGPADASLESRAYVNFNFGGDRALPRNFHYGLRLDYDQRFLPAAVPSVLQVDFNRAGFNTARLNGLPFMYREYALNQVETIAVGAAAASSTVVVDFTLLAIGAVGVGVAGAAAIDNADDDGSPTSGSSAGGSTAGGGTTGTTTGDTTGSTTGSTTGNTTGSTTGSTTGNTTGNTTGGSTTGGGTTGGSTTGGSTTGGGLTGGLLGLSMTEHQRADGERASPEYIEWLDGGSGQMGDLSPAR